MFKLIRFILIIIILPHRMIFGGLYVRKIEMCMTNSRYKFEAEIKQINETHQMLNGWYRSKYPIGNDLSFVTKLFLLIRNKWTLLMAYKGNSACSEFELYMRDALHSVQRFINMRPGCPILPINVTMKDLIFSFNLGWRITTLPVGRLRLTTDGFNTGSREKVLCVLSEYENSK